MSDQHVVIELRVSQQTAADIEAAANRVGLTAAEWVLALTEGPLRHFRQTRHQEQKPPRQRTWGND